MSTQSHNTTVNCSINGGVARIQLNRPDRHNALNLDTIEHLERALVESVSRAGVRAVVICATPATVFCAGADLDELGNGRLTPDRFHDLLDAVAACPLPTIAAVSGNCHGGGAELPLACDFRIGVDTLTIQVPATRIGLCYPPRGIQRYTQRLGPIVAKRILLAGERCDAEALRAFGYLDRICQAQHLDGVVDAFAADLSALAPLSVQATKELIDCCASGLWSQAKADKWVARCKASEDLKRGLDAARRQTRPQFQGD
ncbi:MAG: enoyl-CoA hydratase/isomerase family protein [Pseudomonadota bacterium]